MEVQVRIGFDQLVKMAKMLPKRQLNQLLNEIKAEETAKKLKQALSNFF